MSRFIGVLFLFGTLGAIGRSEDVPRPEVNREELRQALEEFGREHPGVVPDLRPTVPPISEQLDRESYSNRSQQYCHRCKRDSRGRIRRSAAARAEFRREHPCPATGSTRGACPGYVIDHVIALKRGGADSPENMQWQTVKESKAKDKWE